MKRRCLAISRWWRASHRQPVTPSPWADRNTPTFGTLGGKNGAPQNKGINKAGQVVGQTKT